MKVRLGFAVAAQMEPDILLIDEVLAVGDIHFRIKCLTRIGELINKTAVIFVSHSMPQVSRICDFLLLMHRGNSLVNSYDIPMVVETYFKAIKRADKIQGLNTLISLNKVIIEQEGESTKTGNKCIYTKIW